LTLRQTQGRPTPLPRELFAATENYAYLNHAAVGVLPQPTRDALRAFVDAHASGGVMGVFPYEARMPEYRDRIAKFVGAESGTIAVLRNTGDGANVIAGGLQWKAGDEVILPDNEFPANAQPWLALRKGGVNMHFVQTARERLTPDVLRRHISNRTKVVTVSWVSFADGYRHDLAALAEIAHAHGAILAVDAIQGLGAFPLDVRECGIDALYCGGAKWMLALQGVSFLYVAPALNERLAVAAPGWRSAANMWDFLDYEQPFAHDATRFEGGTPNFIGALSLAQSIEVIASAGPARVAAHVLALTDRLVDGLRELGADIATIRGRTESSGIVTFCLPGCDPVAIGKALQREGVVTTYRASGVRVAPHGYNTFDDVEALIAGVTRYRKEVACST
jgi:selenocysteine lyase/cysteine desulfurase